MSTKSLPVILVFAMLLCMINVQAATIYVPDDYESIQQAIDNAKNGDTIIVRDGIYKENIKTDKSVTLKSENGSANCIVQAAEITADNVTVSGFTIRGAEIYIKANNSVITNNNVETKNHGIYLDYSNNNIITNNNIENSDHGIYVCKDAGICLRYDYGIYLDYSNNNLITNNNIENNNYGIYLYGSNNNSIYLNNFNNNIYSRKSTNHFNSPKPITYQYNGKTFTNYLGNYYNNYKGKDNNGDGIGGTPYQIDSDKDYYPLIAPVEQFKIISTR